MFKKDQQRYPKGSPLGGRFMPEGYDLPPLRTKIIPHTDKFKLKNKYLESIASEYVLNSEKSLNESAKPHLKNAISSGLTKQDVQQINAAIAKQAGDIIRYSLRIRPEIADKLTEYEMAWEDFGTFPAVAFTDHIAKQTLFNPQFYLNAKRPYYMQQSEVMGTVIHELSHNLDHSLAGNGKSNLTFTRAFEPMNQFFNDYIDKMGHRQWMADSGLAYPMSAMFGAAKNYSDDASGMSYSSEYISTISEMYFTDPQYMDSLDSHFKEIGYQGPTMRDLMERIWGVNNKRGMNPKVRTVNMNSIRPSDFGGDNSAKGLEFVPGNARNDFKKFLSI